MHACPAVLCVGPFNQHLQSLTMLTIKLLSKDMSALASSSAAIRHNNAQKKKFLQVCHITHPNCTMFMARQRQCKHLYDR